MLTQTERQEILKTMKKYKYAHAYLSDHYKSRRARAFCEKASKMADKYLYKMKDNKDKITSEDVKCFAVLVDNFEQMRRNHLLNELQQYADFDVFLYVDRFNNGSIKSENNKTVKEMSAEQMDKLRSQYKVVCNYMSQGKRVSKNTKKADKYRTQAYSYARSIVSGDLQVSPENLESTYMYLHTICFPYVDGDVADRAKILLKQKMVTGEEIVQQAEPVENKADANQEVQVHERIQKLKKRKEHVSRESSKEAISKQVKDGVNTVIGNLKQTGQDLSDRVEQLKKEIADIRKKREKERELAQQQAEREKAEREEQRANEKAEASRKKQERKQARHDKMQTFADNSKSKITGFFGSVASKISKGKDVLQEKYTAFKEARREKDNAVKPENTEEKIDKSTVIRYTPYLLAWLVLAAGICIVVKTGTNNAEKMNDKKDAKAVVVSDEVVSNVIDTQTTVTLDTAYAKALKNYYNSALDIIAGENKKDDVLSKIENQVNNGNIALADSVTVERIAYAYFIYREYGFKKDILELAVNGNQKLDANQQAELIQVIMDAGERGTGVQKMAKQSVESRGGSMSQHSKFKNATKQQQRQHLVSLGLLKKAHVK